MVYQGTETNNFYEQSNFSTIEKLVLNQDIQFSSLNINIEAEFVFPIMNPDPDTSGASTGSLTSVGSKGNIPKKGKYQKTETIRLKIPKYLLWQFIIVPDPTQILDYYDTQGDITHGYHLEKRKSHWNRFIKKVYTYTIPKGQVFLGAYIGGEPRVDKLVIIGLVPDSSKEELKYDATDE